MFSLIITIISIALVAALALATLYYGGSAFNRGSAGAVASQLINEGQQLNGAVAVAKADAAAGGTAVVDLQDLVDGNYLSQLPASFASLGATTIASGAVTVVAASADVCTEVNKRAGHTAAITGTVANAPGMYGCGSIGATGSEVANTFYYKF